MGMHGHRAGEGVRKVGIMLVMQRVIEAVQTVRTRFESDIKAFETGTIRTDFEKHESTLHIARGLRNVGHLISVDNNACSIHLAKGICQKESNITWIESDSIKYLKSLKDEMFHFVLLDSVNKAGHIFEEFKLVSSHIVDGGLLIIDDAGLKVDGSGIDRGVPAEKAHAVWKFVKKVGAKFSILQGAHGTQLMVRFGQKSKDKILKALNN